MEQYKSTEEKRIQFPSSIFIDISDPVINTLDNQSAEVSNHKILQEISSSIHQATTFPLLSQLVWQILKGNQLVNHYFITFNPPADGSRRHFYDEKAVFANDAEFIELLNQPLGFGGDLNASLLSTNIDKHFNVRLAVQTGGVTPWVFFLNRIGIVEIIGMGLRYGNRQLGVLWFEPKVGDMNLFKAICAQISIAAANIQSLEIIEKQAEEISKYKQSLQQQIVNKETELAIYADSEIIGTGPQMQKVYEMMHKVSSSYATVLITGETGTGKELIAIGIHNRSTRKDQPLIKVNCAALPANLIESELFGHERGSFTGATERRIGKFEMANNGTLFLDEIGEIPPELQVKLLRAIQEKEIERVGGSKTIKVNVRLIAATNRNLHHEVEQGRFRSDLYYRLNVFPIEIPSLRARREDIPELVQHFINRYGKKSSKGVSSVSKSVLNQMTAYQWPGNVRELEHLIERSILLANGTILQDVYLPAAGSQNPFPEQDDSNKTLEEIERQHIIRVLNSCSGIISGKEGAALKLGIPATTLSSKLSRLKISRKQRYE